MILGHELSGDGADGVIVMRDFYGRREPCAFARNVFDVRNFTLAFTELRGYGESRHLPGDYAPAEVATVMNDFLYRQRQG